MESQDLWGASLCWGDEAFPESKMSIEANTEMGTQTRRMEQRHLPALRLAAELLAMPPRSGSTEVVHEEPDVAALTTQDIIDHDSSLGFDTAWAVVSHPRGSAPGGMPGSCSAEHAKPLLEPDQTTQDGRNPSAALDGGTAMREAAWAVQDSLETHPYGLETQPYELGVVGSRRLTPPLHGFGCEALASHCHAHSGCSAGAVNEDSILTLEYAGSLGCGSSAVSKHGCLLNEESPLTLGYEACPIHGTRVKNADIGALPATSKWTMAEGFHGGDETLAYEACPISNGTGREAHRHPVQMEVDIGTLPYDHFAEGVCGLRHASRAMGVVATAVKAITCAAPARRSLPATPQKVSKVNCKPSSTPWGSSSRGPFGCDRSPLRSSENVSPNSCPVISAEEPQWLMPAKRKRQQDAATAGFAGHSPGLKVRGATATTSRAPLSKRQLTLEESFGGSSSVPIAVLDSDD